MGRQLQSQTLEEPKCDRTGCRQKRGWKTCDMGGQATILHLGPFTAEANSATGFNDLRAPGPGRPAAEAPGPGRPAAKEHSTGPLC